MKTSENLKVFWWFQGYENVTLERNGLKAIEYNIKSKY